MKRGRGVGLAVFWLVLTALPWTQVLRAGNWQVDYARSTIGFVATYDSIPFEGRFEVFTADIDFEPAAMPDGSFAVSIDVGSANTGSPDRDQGMLEQEWFDAARYPAASFDSTGFHRVNEGDSFEVSGRLAIKDAAKPVTLPFTWVSDGRSAHLYGRTVVKRADFNIGTGAWAADDTIGFDVEIVFDLSLQRGN